MSSIYKKGFTLIELIVTMSIVTLLMTTVLFNYGTFNDNLAISSAEQEMAVAIRQAQTYGLNVKETAASSGQFGYAYGIYFNPQSPTDYYLFADADNNKKYDVGSGCGSGSTECIEKFSLRNGVRISNICDSATCYSTKNLNITFLRPVPDAVIYLINNSDGSTYSSSVNTGKIELTSSKGKVLKVTIESTGQVLVD